QDFALMHTLPGPLCGPSRHKAAPTQSDAYWKWSPKKTGCKSRFSYAPKKLMHAFQKNVTPKNKQPIQ
ncbi:hypothetical protein, partial [Pseudomonas juntendi]|uniref:hypothetical protein n=1 Tax=Pseudomonas juntendi TaxID=2666183 RepID=UPI003F75E4F6